MDKTCPFSMQDKLKFCISTCALYDEKTQNCALAEYLKEHANASNEKE